jgi:hypothetical protein
MDTDTNDTNDIQINLLDIDINAEECMICKEELSCYPCYTLPECGHIYHTNCLVSWFRNGDSRCPYCGNKGLNYHESKNELRRFKKSGFYCVTSFESQYLNDIRKFCNSKKYKQSQSAIKIQKHFEKITTLENELKTYQKEYNEFKIKIKQDLVNYNDAKKSIHKYRQKRWRINRNINYEKLNLVHNSYIIPLVIPLNVVVT